MFVCILIVVVGIVGHGIDDSKQSTLRLIECVSRKYNHNQQTPATYTYGYLDLPLGHIKILLTVHVHPLQGVAHRVGLGQENHCKATCKRRRGEEEEGRNEKERERVNISLNQLVCCGQ